MKAILNIHARLHGLQWGIMTRQWMCLYNLRTGHRGKCLTVGDNCHNSKKAVFKISGSQLMKDKKSGVMTIKCNVKILECAWMKEKKKKTYQDNWGNQTLDSRSDNSIVSRLNSLHVILCRKCPCSQEICMNYLWFLKGSVKKKIKVFYLGMCKEKKKRAYECGKIVTPGKSR